MQYPVRVLQVFSQMNRGGAETMIMNLYRNINRSKVQFDFIVHTDKKCAYDDEILSLGGKIFRVPRYNGKNHFQYIKTWKEFFITHPEYNIIHGHVRSTASIYLKIAKKFGLTTIAHSHSTSSGNGIPGIVKLIFQYPIRYMADYLFACSKSAGEWLYGKRVWEKKNFFILNNAIETNKFLFNINKRDFIRNELQIQDKFVIGHVGRFHPLKNHEFLIDIFNEVYKKHENSVLVLIGDGEKKNYIKQKINRLGLNKNVIFTGIRSDVHDLLQAFDVFVFPSLYEGLPVTLIEAQASGLPCIVSDKITTEVKVTDLIKFISLDKNAEYWAEEILKTKNSEFRPNTMNQIIQSGYDVEASTKWYEEFVYHLV